MMMIMIKQDAALKSAAGRPAFSIQMAANRSRTCAACGKDFTGGGPLGHRGEDPVCDLCLFEGSSDLGMVMALISVTRAFATIYARVTGAWIEPLRELGTFARVYELVAAKSWPRRSFDVPGFTARDDDC